MGAPLAALVALALAGSISVRTNKGILVPGTDASAELLVVARGFAPGARLDLAATSGKVTNVRPLGDGRFQATFVPEKGAPPTVAFVTARLTSGEETELGHAAIAVHGVAAIQAEVAPGSRVTIDAGGRSFGPFTADGRGRLHARILVPPRLREVTLRQPSGERKLPLELPPVSLVHAAIPGEASHGHGEEPLLVEILTVDRTGYPAWRPPPRLTADVGEVAPLGLKSPGVFRFAYQAPASPASGVARLTARIPEDPASSATLEVRLRPPRPAAAAVQAPISLQLSRRQVISGEGGAVAVEVRRGRKALAPGELAAARVETSLGTAIPAAGGVRWILPQAFGGHSEATIRVEAGGATAEDRVALLPGPPAAGRIAFDAARVQGGRAVGARVRLTDAHHNPVAGARLTPRAPRGEASAVVEDGAGAYRFTFRTPEVEEPEELRLEVAVEGGPVLPAPPIVVAPRSSGPALWGGVMAGGHGGLLRGHGGTPAAELAVQLPSLPLELVARASWSPPRGAGQAAFASGPGGEAGVRGTLAVRPWLGWHLWLGAAGQQVDGTVERSLAFSLGATAAVGLGLRAGPGRFLLEGGYLWLPVRGAPGGNLGGPGARAGFLLELW